MRYAVVHRDVDFVVFHSGGTWNCVVGDETRGPYGHRDHATSFDAIEPSALRGDRSLTGSAWWSVGSTCKVDWQGALLVKAGQLQVRC
jgi:hypothetical protein